MRFEAWFKRQGWQPWPFQREAWDAFARGESGLIQVPTGAGKSYAACGGPLLAMAAASSSLGQGLRLLYISPLRALARDIEATLQAPLRALGLNLRVESRTGDTEAKLRARQRKMLPDILITTPESLALLLTQADAAAVFKHIDAVIVDEWHDLQTSKRGVQLQLTLAHLRAFSPQMQTWGLSATLSDPLAAARKLLPVGTEPTIISATMARPVVLTTLLPSVVDPLPWAGHLGLSMLPQLLAALDQGHSSLIFTNTRSQAERWYEALRTARPAWLELMAIHHGSLDRKVRAAVEDGLKQGRLKIVVVTSTLDLGVDFPTVERVFQLGSPKGVARLMQRAGRSSHRPLTPCHAICIPTNSMELLEFAAAREALAAGRIEEPAVASAALDVLVQHLVSCALGGGFSAEALFNEVQTTSAYRDLTWAEFSWCLRFVCNGGEVLSAYPNYHRVVLDQGCYSVLDRRQAQLHRMNIGTIVSDESVELKTWRGKRYGSIEEGYVARLKPGDRFLFAGHTLEFIKLHELTAYVRPAAGRTTNAPIWQGSFLPLSQPLGAELKRLVASLGTGLEKAGKETAAEIIAAAPLIELQRRVSRLPQLGEVLLETWQDRHGCYLFVYPFAGRQVHEAMASLLALRLARSVAATLAVVANDYGFALVSTKPLAYAQYVRPAHFSRDGLDADIQATVDQAQYAKRRFREIARIAGLVHQSYPGKRKGGRAVHASAALLYDTLARFDPGHALVEQARREALQAMTCGDALAVALAQIGQATWSWQALAEPSPFAYPLIIEQVRARIGSESLEERLKQMQLSWRKGAEEADEPKPAGPSRSPRPPRSSRSSRPPRPPASPQRPRGLAHAGTSGLLGKAPHPARRGPPLGQE